MPEPRKEELGITAAWPRVVLQDGSVVEAIIHEAFQVSSIPAGKRVSMLWIDGQWQIVACEC